VTDAPTHSLHPEEDAAARAAHARRARQRLWFALALAASVLALTAIGSWTYNAVERSLRESRAAALKSVLEAQAKTLEVWIEDQKLGARFWKQIVLLGCAICMRGSLSDQPGRPRWC